ncbi:MAG: hypothetical protein CVT65_11160, partial [Actinobacteria bacterium HGW-Actinobacteria-5]
MTRTPLSLLLSFTLAVGALVLGPGAVTPASAAAGDLICGNDYVYALRAAVASTTQNQDLIRVSAATGAWSVIGSFGSGTNALNALAVDGDGTTAYAMGPAGGGSSTMYTFNDATGNPGASRVITGFNTSATTFHAGGVDPTTGLYWVGAVIGTTLYVYSINPASGNATARFTTATGYTTANADLAFDSAGDLYIAFSPSGSPGTLRKYDAGSLSGTPTGAVVAALDTAANGYPGMAFASDGFLYLSATDTLRRARPSTGTVEATVNTGYGTIFSDLGSCATPTVMDAVRKNVVSRAADSDQFKLALTGTGVSLSATTAGTATGVQAATAGPVIVIPGESYTFAETPAGTTNFSNYLSTYRCVDADTGTVLSGGSGSGTSVALTIPATGSDGKGINITCTFTNEAKDAAISLAKHASGTPTKAGDQITYSFTVTNTGNRPLTGVTVTDPMLSAATITCASTSLDVGASTTCSASPAYTVTQADVEAGKVANSASVAASPPTGEGAAGSVTATDTKTVTIGRSAQLKLVKTASGSPFVAGDQISYGFTLTNTGNVEVSDVQVTDALLSGITCTDTVLAPGASTTCAGSPYTVTAADVAAGTVTNTATPAGTSVVGTPAVDPTSTTSVTTTLGTLPSASPDFQTTAQNVTVVVDPLANDTAGATGGGTVGSLGPDTVVFTSPDATNDGRTLVVAGEGAYTIDPATGAISFDPEPAFTGTASVAYRVTDSLGHSATSTVTLTVTPLTPDAVDDTGTTPYLTPVTVAVLDNDVAGATSAPLSEASVVFTSPLATNGGRTLVVAGEGTYTIDPATAAVTFTPDAGFTGAATPVGYRVSDTNGTSDTAALTITVAAPPAPAASPNTATTLQNQDVTLTPAANDSANGGATLDPASVVFTSSSATNGGRTLVVAGEGTYTIDPATGVVSFDPEPLFSGTATAVDYRISDNLGQSATSTITITVTPVHPSATDDSATTPYLTPVTLPGLTNDNAGDASAPLVVGSLVFTDPTATDGGKTLVTTQGTWTAEADGTVRFGPADGFSGPTDAVPYRISDSNGTTATAQLVVTVGTPPAATNDTATTLQNTPVLIDPLVNDAAGASGTSGTLAPTSVQFTSPDAVAGGKKLDVPGEGSYSIDGMTGQVTFTPLPSFSGPATPVWYEVTDSFGNSAAATIAVTVTPVQPTAADDTDHTPFQTPVTTPVLGNDSAGDLSAALVAGSVVLTDPTATDAGKTLTVTGEGMYHVNGDGSVTFTPEAGFSGAATPVDYQVADANGTTASATLTITVGAPPVANPDIAATPQDTDVTVALLGNDTAGTDGAADPGSLEPATVVFTDPAAANSGRTLVVAGEGTYTIDPATGAATFDPEPGFSGIATAVPYRVSDSFGHSADATLVITVTPIIPTATDDTNHTSAATPVTTDVLANDAEGAASAPLVPGSVVISTAGTTDGGKTLVVAGQGTWTVLGTGEISFAPEAGFSGPATIAYQVADRLGTLASATLTITVGAPSVASDDHATTPQNVDVTLHPLANDTAGDDGAGGTGTLDPASLVFTSAAATNSGRTLVVAGEGTWTIDPATGDASFDPEPAFTGPATPVVYQVTDSFGATTQAELSVTVTPVTPSAGNDVGATGYRTPVTLDLLSNDAAGAGSAPLVASSVVFTDPDATDAGKTLVVAGRGTYTIAADGRLTFTPAVGFTGGPSAVAYTVADANGTTATATVTITVAAPPAPSATDDTNHTPYLTTVTTAVLDNDTAGGLATLQPSSVRFTDPAAVNGGTTLVVAGEGTYQVNGTGTISFTPVAGFSGVATAVGYRVSDELGQTGTAQLVVTVGVPPTATDDARTTAQGVPVTFDPLGNDSAGDNGAGTVGALLHPSVVLTSASATDAGRTLVVAGEGTWTIGAFTGEASFAPLPGFTGTTTAVGYAVTDSFGNTATAELVVTVTPVTPVAADDVNHTPYQTPVTTGVLGNDSAGATTALLDPASVVFSSPDATNGGHTLTVPGEGTYEVNADATVTFTPADGFRGTATGVDYRVSDANGTTASATLTITVGTPPVATDDTATTPYDTAVTLRPLDNDTAGDDGAGNVGGLDAASLVFTSPGATDGDHTLVVAGQGSWTIDPAAGAVRFDPEKGFHGSTASVAYRVTDSHGHEATALLTVIVGAPPAASDDTAITPQNVTVTLDPLANDSAGDDGTGTSGTLDAGSV